jgi:ABC-type spermidine/putrescine transport system permease subunit II
MSLSGMVEWFGSQSTGTQVFFGIFLFFIAMPIVTLVVFAFVDSVQGLRAMSAKNAKQESDKDKGSRL